MNNISAAYPGLEGGPTSAMRMKTTGWIASLSILLLAAPLCWAGQAGRASAQRLDFVWKQSLPLRSGDPRIAAIGGTELRALTAFDNKLFAAIGYWMDIEKASPGLPGAQVLRLDRADGSWQIDLELDGAGPGGLRKYQAISTLQAVRFTIDQRKQRLAHPVELLLAGVWKRDVGLDAFSRVVGSGYYPWTRTPIPGQEAAARGTQIRAFSLHKDQITGDEIVFAGASNAIFVGKYDAEQQGIVWQPQPEWHAEGANIPSGASRVASFADCNGKLYATAHGTIFERVDGSFPSWRKIFETPIYLPSPRVTGLRGLTCIRDMSASAGVLLVGVEDKPSRIYRIDTDAADPAGQYKATMELDVSSFLTSALGIETTYAIVAYNNMIEYPDAVSGCPRLLIGLESVTPQAAEWFGDQHFNPHAYYLLRDCHGNYALRVIKDKQIEPEPQLVSVRTLAVTPFPSDPPGTVYAGGFDANNNAVHNTAWLYKGVPIVK
jgi:hypothetical protein